MPRIFEYTVLTAIPDVRRGERANVGLVIFRAEGVDVRLQQGLFKLRALTGQTMEARIQAASTLYQKLFSPGHTTTEMLRRFQSVEPMLIPSEPGWFRAEDDSQYEQRVSEILASLVVVPRQEKGASRSRIATEIQRAMQKANILAGPDETIQNHRIVRDYVVDESEGLVADFALKNGKLHIASTLDLRRVTADLRDAALKSMVLERAKKRNRRGTVCIGIYAVEPDMRDHFQAALNMFEESAEKLFDWSSRTDKEKLSHHFQDAMGLPSGTLFS